MKTTKIIGWIILVVAAVFWITAIGGANGSGFFENSNDVQLMVLGGAISMIGGVFLMYDD